MPVYSQKTLEARGGGCERKETLLPEEDSGRPRPSGRGWSSESTDGASRTSGGRSKDCLEFPSALDVCCLGRQTHLSDEDEWGVRVSSYKDSFR
uniref:Uncharacterized protein n=1 Tax=Oryzias latipes TaxID=8090 RepID=A0A3P9K1L2_ORYLA